MPRVTTIQTALSLQIDTVSAELAQALSSEGIPSILLKGPSIVRLLYTDGVVRPYADTDLLVPFDRLTRAGNVLMASGFKPIRLTRIGALDGRGAHAQAWFRSRDGVTVDLHNTLPMTRAAPKDVWAALERVTEHQRIGGELMAVLRPPGIALHIGLHAAQHGESSARAAEDLDRALSLLDSSIWEEALDLARELVAVPALVRGLRQSAHGRAQLNRMNIPSTFPADSLPNPWIRGQEWAFLRHHLGRQQSVGLRVKSLLRILVPGPLFMTQVSSMARRGRFGLLAAYFCHPFHLLRSLLTYILRRMAKQGTRDQMS